MKSGLLAWIRDADVLQTATMLGVEQMDSEMAALLEKRNDFYLALVGELFRSIRDGTDEATDFARLANALADFSEAGVLSSPTVNASKALVLAAAAFYFGGLPASALLILRAGDPSVETDELVTAQEVLAKARFPRSLIARELREALDLGDLSRIDAVVDEVAARSYVALTEGPEEWVAARLLERLLERFRASNVRAVLPSEREGFWDDLVASFLRRSPPVWDLFPPQIDAIESGLLSDTGAFSLQMPTSSGKTALIETLLYHHLTGDPSRAAVLLVPFRSLASELRSSLVVHLNTMGIAARSAYGGSVPTGEEVQELERARAIVATPEAMSGLLSAEPSFLSRVSLVVVDEGHLLDGGTRGVVLELLLSRFQTRRGGPPRFVFLSAIVPNVDEINVWLGGTEESVVRSSYRAAISDVGYIHRVGGTGVNSTLSLHITGPFGDSEEVGFEGFLSRRHFQYDNPVTGRTNTYSFGTHKVVAVAAARRALPMGAVALFAANKRGNQGVEGLGDELLYQLTVDFDLPTPAEHADAEELELVSEYLGSEYGEDWRGTRLLRIGAVLHHGDIPQETREVLEDLIRRGTVKLAICTNTLAEGVNLPFRTLVLYSVVRVRPDGRQDPIRSRDIANLIGRAGRAGSTTRSLVICANESQWARVQFAMQPLSVSAEAVTGALLGLFRHLRRQLLVQRRGVDNSFLEATSEWNPLVDGIDSILVDFAAEELGEDELMQKATELAEQTFAAQRANPSELGLMKEVFGLRAHRVNEVRQSGRLEWMRSQRGAPIRMIDSVEEALIGTLARWDDVESPTEPGLIEAMVSWAWDRTEMIQGVVRLGVPDGLEMGTYARAVGAWLRGATLGEIAVEVGLNIDTTLRMHAGLTSYTFHMLVEQAVPLLEALLRERGLGLSPTVSVFPEHLRYGVPSTAGLLLCSAGVRHRRAAVVLGEVLDQSLGAVGDEDVVVSEASSQLLSDEGRFRERLGQLVFNRTRDDLAAATRRRR